MRYVVHTHTHHHPPPTTREEKFNNTQQVYQQSETTQINKTSANCSVIMTTRSSYLMIITGASRGFGKAFCLEFAKTIMGPIHVVLVGRRQEELENTEAAMRSIKKGCEISCEIMITDLEEPESLPEFACRLFDRSYDFTKVVYVSNAGTLGPLNRIDSPYDISALSRTLHLNITAPCALLSELLAQLKLRECPAKSVVMVNISSLWALEPSKSFGAYCSSKAAVEMFFEVAAAENAHDTQLKFLNYAPGPLDTAMQQQIREDPGVDGSVRDSCLSLRASGNLVDPSASAFKCCRLAIEELFKTGDHIDYYDQIAGIDYPRKIPTTCCANPDCQCGPACSCSPQLGAQCGACHSFLLGNRLPKNK
jgi:sepiapterin reductase